ncbi:hypothetical protein [Mycobacterium simiae]|uniref:hypothetical protein n=1 Tax=Mycobacterium simiae TaxID=1784 RepID=UPI0004092560|nr:hypothetical protein [Mycobacterium simiae]PLV53002.1 hypothetical protein X011_07990 [Mycobacterium tuberculosis variant microti OV254]BBX39265.1 hypothetical protein MSIM_07160 [Mycobacterium simiae]
MTEPMTSPAPGCQRCDALRIGDLKQTGRIDNERAWGLVIANLADNRYEESLAQITQFGHCTGCLTSLLAVLGGTLANFMEHHYGTTRALAMAGTQFEFGADFIDWTHRLDG